MMENFAGMTYRKRFGLLRSMLHKSMFVNEQWKRDLYDFLRHTRQEYPVAYEEEWIPYLDTFSAQFRHPLRSVVSLAELQEAVSVAPFACFSLDLWDDNLSVNEATEIVSSPWVDFLGHMYVGHGAKGPVLGEALVLRMLKNLTRAKLSVIDIWDNGLTDQTAQEMAQCEHLSGVRILRLVGNEITSHGHAYLAHSPHLRNVRVLCTREETPALF